MNCFQWNIDTLASLGRIFLHEVKTKLRCIDGATVQFGKMGQGIHPNYQVCFPNGTVNTYRGANHTPFLPPGAFKPGHISQPFFVADLQRAFDAAVAAR
ncbi:hypothetical protein G3435_08310 [Pseudomonas sp. MAFF212428]|uniref:Uncharacterized protein n=1 Tax=Pseudomonas brassicae TaxID=2708063 RepID=A0A6B3NQL8_9PSED|nr:MULTISPECIES: hypothetical protein [Pseudomonas]NER59975.1 hypothetical protein [Pseudomonas brassicae]NER63963.1 hypothetical protein [Pseudomonas brassicae]